MGDGWGLTKRCGENVGRLVRLAGEAGLARSDVYPTRVGGVWGECAGAAVNFYGPDGRKVEAACYDAVHSHAMFYRGPSLLKTMGIGNSEEGVRLFLGRAKKFLSLEE